MVPSEFPNLQEIHMEREKRHEMVAQMAFKTRLKQPKSAPSVSLKRSSRISYAKEEYMFAKYIKSSEVKEDEVEVVKPTSEDVPMSPQQNDINYDGYDMDLTPDEPEDIKAFPTIKDVAEFEAKKTEELWNRVESENFDFTNFKKDEEDMPLSRRKVKKVKRNSVVVKVEGDNHQRGSFGVIPKERTGQTVHQEGNNQD